MNRFYKFLLVLWDSTTSIFTNARLRIFSYSDCTYLYVWGSWGCLGHFGGSSLVSDTAGSSCVVRR